MEKTEWKKKIVLSLLWFPLTCTEARSVFSQILSRYDIIVILEVVDVSGTSVRVLLKELNKSVCILALIICENILFVFLFSLHTDCVPIFFHRVNTAHHYALQLSSRLGRNRYKEQFLFLYRYDQITSPEWILFQ